MLGAALEHHLVDVAVEGFAWKIDELGDAFEVVEDLVGGLAELAIARVEVREDAGAAGVQPVAWVGLGVAGAKAFCDGGCGVDVVGGVGCV